MRHDFFDRFSQLDSPIHHLPASLKLPVSLGIIFTSIVVSIDKFGVFLLFFLILIMVTFLSRIPWRFVGGRLLFFEPLVLGIALMSLFQHHGDTIILTIVLRSTLCLLTVILLSNTTPFSEILFLFRKIRIPALLVTVLALTYRYVFVLIDEAMRLRRARDSRIFVTRRTGVWLSLSSLIGQLFIRSTERSGRIYTAMISRGWK